MPKRRDMHNDSEACFIQLHDIDFSASIPYDGIKSTYGLILLFNSPITKYIAEAADILNLQNEDEFAVLSDLCYLAQLALSNKLRKSDWQQQIERVFDRRNNPQYHEFAFSKISFDKLVEACEKTEFRLYDTSKWYRSSEGYQWIENPW